jgi:uncharacterized protein (TIGR03437 family)
LNCAALVAAPKLRLVTSTVGPVLASTGAAGPAQTVEAYNLGDGTLALTLTVDKPSSAWLATTAGAARPCQTTTAAASCIPLQFTLNTAALSAGTYTGIVTVNDPKAVDSPQTITVTVRVGGIDAYVAPGTVRDFPFMTNGQISWKTTTQDGGSWLNLAINGTGSFRFNIPYRIRFQPPAGMAQGIYNGSAAITSSIPAETRTVPVTMRVTTQPIAQPTTDRVRVRLAQGAPPLATGVALSNAGQGSLTVSAVSVSGLTGVTATSTAAGAVLNFDPGTQAAGFTTGSLTISTNAVNGPVIVPVDFEIVAKGAPVIAYQGVQDNAVFTPGDIVTPGDIMVVKGEQLSFDPLTLGKAAPLATQVGGATVLVNGAPAPMYYSSYGQLAFQMPVEIPTGTALVQVQRDGQTSNTVSVDVAARAPRLLRINVGDYGAIQNQDFSLPMPVGAIPGIATHPAQAGDTLTIYAIGLGQTNPAVATGQPAPSAEPFARVTSPPTVRFGAGFSAINVEPLFTGLTPTYAGLYQVNVTIPDGLSKGNVDVTLDFAGAVSNTVQIAVQ